MIMVFYGITFLSAFLLFQIQLIMARLLLPQYGGSFWVWGSCLVFFQTVLLLGYLFCERVIARRGVARYRRWHLALMTLPLLVFPGRALEIGAGDPTGWLALEVFWRLLWTVGPVFFVLSTMAVFTQMWLASSLLKGRENPYVLFAVSDAGSLLALVSYPLVFEVVAGISAQVMLWRAAYGLLLVLVVAAVWKVPVMPDAAQEAGRSAGAEPVPWSRRALWFLTGAAGVALFLSVNTLMTNEMPPVPLVWVWPMSIYLLTFSLAFKRRPWLPSAVMNRPELWLGWAAILFLMIYRGYFPVIIAMVLLLGTQFVLSLYCQGRLYRSRPLDKERLPSFYVIQAFGGAVGGIFMTWVIPLVTRTTVEFLISLFLVSLIAPLDSRPEARITPSLKRLIVWWMIFLAIWPQVFLNYHFWGMALLIGAGIMVFREFTRSPRCVRWVMGAMVLCWPWLVGFWDAPNIVSRYRNYYGIYKVRDAGIVRRLESGTTLHGAQLKEPALWRGQPVSYYSPSQSIGQLLLSFSDKPLRVGVLGLGVGTLSAYNRDNWSMDFYEIDPLVLTIAREHFSYLSLARGKVDVILGDARVQLERQEGEVYDLLIFDAFGGDSIPVHLVNREMIQIYRQKLKPGGILVLHVSNRYIHFEEAVRDIALSENAWAFESQGLPVEWYSLNSRWMVLTWDPAARDSVAALDTWKPVWGRPERRVWSDDYANFLPVLKYQEFVQSFKNFRMFNW